MAISKVQLGPACQAIQDLSQMALDTAGWLAIQAENFGCKIEWDMKRLTLSMLPDIADNPIGKPLTSLLQHVAFYKLAQQNSYTPV